MAGTLSIAAPTWRRGPALLTRAGQSRRRLRLKALKDGKDLRAINSPEFWGAALVQAGGMGIFGDFLFANVNRFGNTLTVTLAGPLPGKLGTYKDLIIGNAVLLITGEKPKFGAELTNALRQNTPVIPWYLRAGYERVLLDELQKLLDPEAHQAFRRREDRTRRDYGQDYWWRLGETTPRRMPDLAG